MYTDRSMTCVDCGQEFSFTAGEQEFYAQRGFTESPKRCPSCRQIRKAQRSRTSSYDGGSSRSDGYSNGNGGYGDSAYASGGGNGGYSASGSYSAGGYSSGGGGGGGYSSGGGGYSERRPREMFEAVCANCGKTASVPFRPSGSKPVYCSDCFESRR